MEQRAHQIKSHKEVHTHLCHQYQNPTSSWYTWEVNQKMNAERLSKTKMAALIKTSRSALDRLLDPANTSVTLHTLDNAARAIGKTLHIELI